MAIALALSLVPEFLLAQIMPGTASRPAGSSTSPAAVSAAPSSVGASAPAGYILSANDQVSVEVFGEDDLRTNGRLNPEGNLSVPLLGSIHLAGLTLTQAASRIAAPERITVRRHNGNGDQVFKVNAKRFTKGSGGGFLVEPGDTITVGESIF